MKELNNKLSVNNSDENSIFMIFEAKSKEIIEIVNVNDNMDEEFRSQVNQNIINNFKDLNEKLSDINSSFVIEFLDKNLKALNEVCVNLIHEIKEFLLQDLSNIRKSLDDYTNESTQIKNNNKELYDNYISEISKNKDERQRSEELLNAKSKVDEELFRKEVLLKETQEFLKDSEVKVLNLEEEKKNLQMSIETLKMNFKSSDNLCNDLCEKIKNLEINQTQLSKNLDGKNIKYETCKQVVKNILTLYLEEEYFIDSIEKCFKNQELHTEETLKTSKIIKINLVVKLYKYIFNEILKPKLSKYIAFEKIFIEINSINYEFKNLDNFYLFSMRLQTDEENLLNRFIIELLENYESNCKTIIELKENIKKSREMAEDSKKNDFETKDLISKQISKLQNDCKEYAKLEKTLRETIESLDYNLKEEKSEVSKLSTKLKAMKLSYDNLEKEYSSLKDNNDNLSQKVELYKLENSELVEKFKDKTNELIIEKDNYEMLLSEKKELLNQLSELDKLKIIVKEKNDLLSSKDIELNKLKNSYQSLEDIFENLKDQQEKEKEDLKQQLLDSLEKNVEYEQSIRTLEEKHYNNTISNQVANEYNEKIAILESENIKLKEQKLEIKKHAEEVLVRVRNDLKETEFLIDKRIISSFMFKYLDRNNNEKIRLAVLDTLSNFLGFSNDERKKIGLNPSSGNNFNTSHTDKLKDISDNLYNFILNA